jgi:hypothetical protein
MRVIRVNLLCGLVVLMAASCDVSSPANGTSSGVKPPADRVSPFAPEDTAVLRTVLVDVLTAPSGQSPLANRTGAPPPTIRFSMQPMDAEDTMPQAVSEHEQQEWTDVPPHQRPAASIAALNVR